MFTTFSDLKDNLTGLVGGVDLAKVSNLNDLVARSARRVLLKTDPPTTKRKHLITLYDEVYDYAVPSDDDFKKAFDLRPQTQRSQLDNFTAKYSEEFDRRKRLDDALISTEWADGTQYFRIKRSVQSKTITLDSMEAVGNWAVQGDGSNLTVDTIQKAKGSASLNFDLTGATTNGGIVNASLTSKDMTDHDERSSFFLNVYLPNASAITSIGLRWGNSASVYWERVVTTPHFGSFVNGWNLVRFDWNGATETGTVDPSAIDYARIDVIYDGTADTDFAVDNLVSRIGYIYELWYYSKFLFRTSAGQWQKNISADTDIINLDEDVVNILAYECQHEVGKQLRDDEMKQDAQTELVSLYEHFKASYPSEKMNKRGTYYRI